MKIEGIKKISMSIRWGDHKEKSNMLSETASLEFIYGIGISGLSPFEALLSGKTAGDELSFQVKRNDLAEYFMYLTDCFYDIPCEAKEIYFRLKIIDVSEAGQKEVIKAMAEMAACGDYCCGGH